MVAEITAKLVLDTSELDKLSGGGGGGTGKSTADESENNPKSTKGLLKGIANASESLLKVSKGQLDILKISAFAGKLAGAGIAGLSAGAIAGAAFDKLGELGEKEFGKELDVGQRNEAISEAMKETEFNFDFFNEEISKAIQEFQNNSELITATGNALLQQQGLYIELNRAINARIQAERAAADRTSNIFGVRGSGGKAPFQKSFQNLQQNIEESGGTEEFLLDTALPFRGATKDQFNQALNP